MSSQLINRVIELTNAERAKAGLGALTLNNQLAEAAQGHSDSMAADDFFSHTGADGSTVSDRVQEEGYEFARTGENIAAGQTTAEQVVEGWMNSPGHRANILNADYTEIGIGYELLENDTGSVNYNRYWTQVFGKPLNGNSQVSNDVPNPPLEENNSIDPVAVEDNSSNDLPEETPDVPVFEQQPSNSDTLKPDLAPVSEAEAPLTLELTPIEATPTIENEDSLTDLDANPLEMEMGELATPKVEAVSEPEIAPANEVEAPIEDLTPVEATPAVETEDPLTNNLDVNLFGMEMGDSIPAEVEEVSEDLTGGSSNLTLTGGDDIMTSASTESFSYSESFSSSDGNVEDMSEMLSKSWLGTSEFDLSNFQSEVIGDLADSNFSWDRQQQIAESIKSFL